MPQLVKKRRSGWAVLAAGALVASLLAVGAAPAAAIDEDSKADNKADFTACLGSALADAEFTDLGGLDAAVADINCLASYGITTGKTADTFDPSSNVTRGQMALFLSRAAKVMGVDLMGGDMDADFGDIAELGENRQAAITSLASNGILAGRGDMAFDPHGAITRAEMAIALVSLVAQASDEVRKNKDTGLFELKQPDDTYDGPNDSFDDAYENVSARINNAISAAYELGITTGTGDGTDFSPNGFVPRRNMASFITRALAHTNARPVDVSAQVGGGELQISVRDGDFAPVVNQAVDVFMVSSTVASKAFKADGTCSSRVAELEGTSETCEVDGSDVVTLSDGNVSVDPPDTSDGNITLWAWAGDIGDEYGSDTDDFELEITQAEADDPVPARVTVSNDLGDDVDFGHFGETITITVQLQGDGRDTIQGQGDPADDDYVDVGPTDETKYRVTVDVHAGGVEDNGNLTNTSSLRRYQEDLTIGEDGSASFEVSASDPDPSQGNANTSETSLYGKPNEVTIAYAIAQTSPEPTTDDPALTFRTPDGGAIESAGNVTFSDVKPGPRSVDVDAGLFQDAPSSGKAGNAVTVTVKDQFGNLYRGAAVTISSTQSDADAEVSLPTRARVTGRSGTVRIGYSYEGGAGAQILVATHSPGGTGEPVMGSATVFWVDSETHKTTGIANSAATGDNLGTGPVGVLSLDPAKSLLVVDVDGDAATGTTVDVLNIEPASLGYDSNDYYFVDSKPSGLEDFLAALGKQLQKVADADAGDQAGLTPTLEWSNYIYDDESERTSFELVIP